MLQKDSSPVLTAPLREEEESFSEQEQNISIENATKPEPTIIFKEYGYRYWVCFFYAMSNISLNVLYISCSPITSDLKYYYNSTDFIISSASLVYLLFYMPSNFPSNYILDKYGIRVGVTIGTILTLIGSWLRILINQSFYYVILGSFISSLGQPLIFNAPSKIASNWFKPESRVKATTFLSILSPIGFAIGFLMPGVLIGDTSNMEADEFKDKVWNLFFYQSIVFTVICFPGLFFFREKPINPPSASADVEKTDFKESFPTIVKNKNFMKLLAFFAFSYGGLNALSIVLNILLEPFGFTSLDTSLIGAILIIFGLLGSAIVCVYVAATGCYKFSLVICTIGYLAAVFMIPFCVYSYSILVTLIPIIFLGFFGFPILPICFEACCELTFPVGEAFSTGLLVSSAQLLATIATIILEFAFTEQTKESSVICFGVFFGLVFFGMFFLLSMSMEVEFKRCKFEKKKNTTTSVVFVSCAKKILKEAKQRRINAKNRYSLRYPEKKLKLNFSHASN